MINSTKEKVAAIIPALDEEKNVGEVLKVLLRSKILDQIILVDDGSTDKTAEIGEKLGVTVIRLPEVGGSGKGNAMRKGVLATDAKIIVFFDADLVGLSEDHVSLLLEPMTRGDVKMCIGVRDRLFGLPSLIAKMDPVMAIGGERAIKRDLFEKISDKFIQGFAVEPTLNYYCWAKELPIERVFLEKLDVITKEKKRGFFKGSISRVKMIFEIIRIRLILKLHKNEFI